MNILASMLVTFASVCCDVCLSVPVLASQFNKNLHQTLHTVSCRSGEDVIRFSRSLFFSRSYL